LTKNDLSKKTLIAGQTTWLQKISPVLRPGHHTGYKEAPTFWVEATRSIYDHELVLFGNGDFIVEIDKQKYQCSSKTFIIIPPGKEHKTINVSGRPAFRYWVHFDWTYARDFRNTPIATYLPTKPTERLFHRAPDFVPDIIFTGKMSSFSRVLELHKRLCERHNYGNNHEKLTCRAILLEILLELLDERIHNIVIQDRTQKLTSNIRQMLSDAVDDVTAQTATEIPSVQKLLADTGYSYAYLYRLFKKAYGVSPISYINSIRIERAKFMLQDTVLKISQIARKLGFESHEYFARLFRKSVGLSPSEYREKISINN